VQSILTPYQNSTFSGYLTSNKTVLNARKSSELANHLGNVLSVISDKVIPHANGTAVDYYLADIRQSQDYSPFGVTLSGRNFTKAGADDFRFGFNGMEADPELKGQGNSYTTEFRQYDPRLGRWLTIDPKFKEFPWQSAYVAFDNKPILLVDPKGLAAQGGDKSYKNNKDGSRSRKNGDGSSTYDAPGFTEITIPSRAVVLGTIQDLDGKSDGAVHNNGVQYQASVGDLNQFKVDNVVYTAKFSKGKFMGYYSDKDLKYTGKSPSKSVSNNDSKKESTPYQDLTLSITSGSSGVGLGAFGVELDVASWQYYGVSSETGEGWDEGKTTITMHDFGFFEPGVGSTLKPGLSVEVLSIGGGILNINKDYLKKHPTKSLVSLLNDKNIITISGAAGYKYTYIDIFSEDLELIATGSVHSFALGVGAGTRQGTTSF
jgi:RHS repeat-associated protein